MIRINNGQEIYLTDRFPDGTLSVKIDKFTTPRMIEWYYESDSELFTLICLMNHFEKKNGWTLYMPYLPHARMDRVKHEDDVFTLKYFCNIINSLHFDSVDVKDVHSNVGLALLDNVFELDVNVNIIKAINNEIAYWSKKGEENVEENLVIFFPDVGAKKRYENLIGRFPIGYGEKDRCWETGEIRGLIVHNAEVLKDKHVIIIDDICSRGGTFYHSAKALKEKGVKSVSLYVTHCENTIAKGDIFKGELIENIYTTSSLVHSPEVKERVKYV